MRDLRSRSVTGCVVVLLVLLSGCGGSKKTVNVAAAPDGKVMVEMKASNYAFDPGVIVARKGDTLVLNVTNVSGEKHNITVKDPAGKVIKMRTFPATGPSRWRFLWIRPASIPFTAMSICTRPWE